MRPSLRSLRRPLMVCLPVAMSEYSSWLVIPVAGDKVLLVRGVVRELVRALLLLPEAY